ncbi:MAG: DegV family protein [Eubacterium sp.]|nr:DegV family protein [Eubacterium sp.]
MVKIFTDSTSDLSKELLEKYNIGVIPLYIHLGEEEYKDGEEIGIQDAFKWSDENKTTPKTAACSIDDVIKAIEPYKESGDDVIIFTISGEMSSTLQVMRMAAEEMEYEDHMFVIDSRNLSTGIGLLIMEAAVMAEDGKSAEEIVAKVNEYIPKSRASFVIDTLVYLARGGRCSAVAALVGGMLNIKPKIVVKDGAMGVDKKYRGPYKKVILQYAKDLEPQMLNAKKDRVFVTHTPCDDGIVESVVDYVKSLNYFDEVIVTEAGTTIGSHCGPNTLGVLFIEK